MRIIDGGDRLFAAGLDWEHSHLGVFSKAEVRRLAATHKATHFVEHRTPAGLSGPEHAYGFGRLSALPAGEKRQVISLASAVASPRSDAFIFVAPLDDGEAVFIGVLSGQPTAGNDFIGSEAQVAEAAAHFRDANGVLQVYYCEALGKPEFLVDKGFECKLMELDTSSPNAMLHRIGRVSPFLAGALSLLMLGAGILGLLAWKKADDEASMRTRTPAVSPDLAYTMSRDEALRNYSPIPISVGFPALNALLLNLNTRSGGWRAHKSQCTWTRGSEPVTFACATTWANHGGNYQTFVAPHGTAIEYDDALATLVTHQQLTFPSAQLLGPGAIDLLPTLSAFKLETGSLLQDLGQLDFKVSTSPAEFVGATSSPVATPRLLRLGWSLEGPVDLASTFVPALPPNMTLENAELLIPDLSEAPSEHALPTIKLSGGIYVKQ